MLKLPDFLDRIKTLEEDPPNCVNYAALIKDSLSMFVKNFPMPIEYTNPYDEKTLIDLIHQELDDDQGLIEVKKGLTSSGRKYIASIIKNYNGPQEGVQYFLRVNLFEENDKEWAEDLQVFSQEEETTGYRDSTVYNILKAPKMEDWMRDPYDKSFTKGVRMNLSEEEKWDSLFPYHPLTYVRSLLKYVIENN